MRKQNGLIKSKRDFTSEFQKAKFPFKDTFENDETFRNELFAEFLRTDEKPSLRLYTGKYYTEKQIEAGILEVHDKIPLINSGHSPIAANFVANTKFEVRLGEIRSDFYTKIVKGGLEKKYYCHDLEQTNTIQTLKEIQTTIDILKKSVFNENTNEYKEPETRAESIILSLSRLKNQGIERQVLEAIISEKENIGVILDESNEAKEKWDSIKNTFNLILSKHMDIAKDEFEDHLPDGLFKVLAVNKFMEYEQSMMGTGIYLDSSKKWIGTVDELAAFIWALKEKKYFMGNNTQKIFQKEKDFFKVRYKFDKQLEQKTKPANKQKTKMKEFIIPEL